MSDSPPPTLAATTLQDRYAISAFVGEGATTWIYRGTDTWEARPVAVRVFKPEAVTGAGAVDAVRALAMGRAGLTHAHTTAVLDTGLAEAGPFVVLEWLDGAALAELVEAKGALPVLQATRVARQAAEALQEAHGAGILHGALSPRDVLLCRVGEDEDYVKLSGLGIAAALGQVHPLAAPFQAPEVASGAAADARADLYSLGVVLATMVNGEVPEGPGGAPLPDIAPADSEPVPWALRELAAELVAEDPARRPASAAVVAERLHSVEIGLDYDLRQSQLWRVPEGIDALIAANVGATADGVAGATAATEAGSAGEADRPPWWQFWKRR